MLPVLQLGMWHFRDFTASSNGSLVFSIQKLSDSTEFLINPERISFSIEGRYQEI
jgi:hypothetical protein